MRFQVFTLWVLGCISEGMKPESPVLATFLHFVAQISELTPLSSTFCRETAYLCMKSAREVFFSHCSIKEDRERKSKGDRERRERERNIIFGISAHW